MVDFLKNTVIRVGNVGWLARDGMGRYEVVHEREGAALFTVSEATSIARAFGMRIETLNSLGEVKRVHLPR